MKPSYPSIQNLTQLMERAITCQKLVSEISLKCPDCGAPVRIVTTKEIHHKNKVGCSIEYACKNSHNWKTTIFPIGPQAFHGEIELKDERCEVVITLKNAQEEPQQEVN